MTIAGTKRITHLDYLKITEELRRVCSSKVDADGIKYAVFPELENDFTIYERLKREIPHLTQGTVSQARLDQFGRVYSPRLPKTPVDKDKFFELSQETRDHINNLQGQVNSLNGTLAGYVSTLKQAKATIAHLTEENEKYRVSSLRNNYRLRLVEDWIAAFDGGFTPARNNEAFLQIEADSVTTNGTENKSL